MGDIMRNFSRWLKRIAEWFSDGFDKCEICKEEIAEAQCPCGKNVCSECQDLYMYSDEVCCSDCSREIRQGWEACPSHEFGEPEQNDLEVWVVECSKCGYRALVEAPDSGKNNLRVEAPDAP